MHVVGCGKLCEEFHSAYCWMFHSACGWMWNLDAELCEEFHSAYCWMRNCTRSFIMHVVGCGTV